MVSCCAVCYKQWRPTGNQNVVTYTLCFLYLFFISFFPFFFWMWMNFLFLRQMFIFILFNWEFVHLSALCSSKSQRVSWQACYTWDYGEGLYIVYCLLCFGFMIIIFKLYIYNYIYLRRTRDIFWFCVVLSFTLYCMARCQCAVVEWCFIRICVRGYCQF